MIKPLEELIYENKNLIYKIAGKYSKYYNIDDLFQVGVLGLIKASKNYRDTFNTKFSSYAYPYIFGEIIEFIKNDRMVKVSSDTLKIYKAYEKTKEYLSHVYGRYPSLKEISEFMELEESLISEAIEKSEFVVSLDGIINEDDFSLEKVVGSDKREEIDALMDLKMEIEKLSERDKKLINLRYFKDYTQSETASFLGLNQVQVSRYEKQILKRIKSRIAV